MDLIFIEKTMMFPLIFGVLDDVYITIEIKNDFLSNITVFDFFRGFIHNYIPTFIYLHKNKKYIIYCQK